MARQKYYNTTTRQWEYADMAVLIPPVTDVTVDGTSVVNQNKVAEIDLSGKESVSNKVTSLSQNSTNDEYPSAKAVYDFVDTLVGNADTLLGSGVIS